MNQPNFNRYQTLLNERRASEPDNGWRKAEDDLYWQVRDALSAIFPNACMDRLEEMISAVLLIEWRVSA